MQRSISHAVSDFLRLEAAGGILLLATTGLALLVANSPLQWLYDAFLDVPVSVQIGDLVVAKPLLLWINDGLMAVFFFLIGLEVKREFLEGELSDRSVVAFPAVAALGGMIVPAAVFAWFNWNDQAAMSGWAIPMATDVAFALGLLAMFGARVPTSLKIFLLTLAIFDDLAAIIVIAIFYTQDLSLLSLLIASSALLLAVVMNRRGVVAIAPYMLVGVVMWTSVLKSGVHATLAGVALAFTIPLTVASGERPSPLKQLEYDLHKPVAFVILPLFAFANAGMSLTEVDIAALTHPVTMGVAAGLVIGKFVGVLGFVLVASFLGFARKPVSMTWPQIAGVAALCGVGFTMSLFIAGLAYEHGDYVHFMGDRLGVLVGSVVAAVLGLLILAFALPRQPRQQ